MPQLTAIPSHVPQLQVYIYSTGTTEIKEPLLQQAEVIRANGFYDVQSGGIYESAEIFIPRKNPRASWAIQDMQRVAIYRGLTLIWEGMIDVIGDTRAGGGRGVPGNVLRCVGFWGWLMDGPNAPQIDKPWAVTDVSESTWKRIPTVSAADLCDIHRDGDVIRFIPKLENWANGQVARIEMTVPTGQTIKRIQFNWTLTQAANNWDAYLTNGSGTTIWSEVGATASGTEDLISSSEPFTATQIIRFELRSGASQTSAASDGEFFEVDSLVVSTEEGTIDAEEIALDIIGEHASLNASTNFIDSSLTYPSLEEGGADTNGMKTFGWIARHIAKFGDTSKNPFQLSLIASTEAATPDGLPLLRLETVPDLSDWEYVVSIEDEPRVQVPDIFRKKYIANDMMVTYTGPLTPGFNIVTSDDDSSLKDSDKVTADGSRVTIWDAGRASQTQAILIGATKLTQFTKPDYYMSGPIVVHGTIRTKSGSRADVALVKAGERIKIDDYIDDRSDQVGKGLVLLITGTSLTDDGRQLAITAGTSDDQSLQILKEQQALLLPTAQA